MRGMWLCLLMLLRTGSEVTGDNADEDDEEDDKKDDDEDDDEDDKKDDEKDDEEDDEEDKKEEDEKGEEKDDEEDEEEDDEKDKKEEDEKGEEKDDEEDEEEDDEEDYDEFEIENAALYKDVYNSESVVDADSAVSEDERECAELRPDIREVWMVVDLEKKWKIQYIRMKYQLGINFRQRGLRVWKLEDWDGDDSPVKTHVSLCATLPFNDPVLKTRRFNCSDKQVYRYAGLTAPANTEMILCAFEVFAYEERDGASGRGPSFLSVLSLLHLSWVAVEGWC